MIAGAAEPATLSGFRQADMPIVLAIVAVIRRRRRLVECIAQTYQMPVCPLPPAYWTSLVVVSRSVNGVNGDGFGSTRFDVATKGRIGLTRQGEVFSLRTVVDGD